GISIAISLVKQLSFFFSSRRRHTRWPRDWSSDVCSSDLIIWWDESESDGVAGDNADDFNHTIGEIVISSRAHRNVNGLPYASPRSEERRVGKECRCRWTS